MKYSGVLKMRGTLRGVAVGGLLALVGLFMSISANADLGDDPYFDLYPSSDAGTELVFICGTLNCSGESMLVEVMHAQPAGTGYRESFLRLQESPTETGYNTSGEEDGSTTLQDDEGYTNGAKEPPDHNWNHAVLISDLELVTVDGVDYYEILLDINEPSSKDFIKLDEFEVHLSTTGILSQYNPLDSDFDDGSYAGQVFDMDYWSDADKDDEFGAHGGLILKNCGQTGNPNGRCGSGDEDYSFKIPVSLFIAVGGELTDGMYMHVVASFGETTDASGDPEAISEAGFEEFAARVGPSEVPAPGTVFLLGIGLLGLYGRRFLAA